MDPTTNPHPLRRHWADPAWRGAIIVGLVAAIIRAITAVAQPHGLYFPDSWCYVIVRDGPPCMAHDPATGWFWSVGTLGIRSADSVLWLQGILGIATALMLYRILVVLSTVRWAIAGACLFAVLPVQLLMERTFLSETVETFFIVLGLLVGLSALRAAEAWRAAIWVGAAALSMGCALAVHAAFLLPALAASVVLVVLICRRLWSRQGRPGFMVLGLAAVTSLGLLVPALPEAASYHRWFGVWTTDVAQGTFLLTRWAPLVSCDIPPGTTPRAKAEITAACKVHSFGAPPGITPWLTWPSPVTYDASSPKRIAHERVGLTEAQLRQAAISGMTAHPVAFAGQMLASIGWQIGGAPNDDLWQYRSPKLDRFISPWADDFPDFTQWFGPDGIPRGRPGAPILVAAVAGTTRSGQVLLWVCLGFGAWRLVRRRRQRRPWLPHLTPRTSMAWVSTTMVATSMVAVAFGTYPVFRYWAPITPALIVLAVLSVTSRPKATAEVPTPSTAPPSTTVPGEHGGP